MGNPLFSPVATFITGSAGNIWHFLTLPWDRSPLRFIGPTLLATAFAVQRAYASGAFKPKLLRRGSKPFRRYYEKAQAVLTANFPNVQEMRAKSLALEWTVEDECKNGQCPSLERVFYYFNELESFGYELKSSLSGSKIRVERPEISDVEIYFENQFFIVAEEWRNERSETKYETPQKLLWNVAYTAVPTHHIDNMIHMYNKSGRSSGFIIATETYEQFEFIDGVIRRRRNSLYRATKLKL